MRTFLYTLCHIANDINHEYIMTKHNINCINTRYHYTLKASIVHLYLGFYDIKSYIWALYDIFGYKMDHNQSYLYLLMIDYIDASDDLYVNILIIIMNQLNECDKTEFNGLHNAYSVLIDYAMKYCKSRLLFLLNCELLSDKNKYTLDIQVVLNYISKSDHIPTLKCMIDKCPNINKRSRKMLLIALNEKHVNLKVIKLLLEHIYMETILCDENNDYTFICNLLNKVISYKQF